MKCSHSIFALALGSVSVNGGTGQARIVEVVVHIVDLFFVADKHQSSNGAHAEEKIVKSLVLHGLFHVVDLIIQSVGRSFSDHHYVRFYLLLNIEVGAARTANADANMIGTEIITGKHSAFLVEGGRKHHVSVVIILGSILGV